MKFDISQYKHRYHAMHCPTKESAEFFCAYLDAVGRKWCSGQRYTQDTHWDFDGEDTCYAFNDNTRSDIGWFQREGHPILEFYDFDWGDSDEHSEPKMSFDEVFWGAMQQNQSTI